MKHFTKFIALLGLSTLPLITSAQAVSESLCGNANTSNVDTNIVINGAFTSGNTGFSTTYNYCNSYDCLFPYTDDAYAIGTSASYFHHIFVGTDHTTGTGNFMMVNGQDSSRLVWGENLSVVAGSKYIFSMWISAMDTLPTPGASILNVLINGSSIGTVTIPTATGVWTQLQVAWLSGTNTTANITIKDITSNWNGYDYGLDDIALQRCQSYHGTAGINNQQLNPVSISPNPGNGVLKIANCPANAQIEVYDPIGKKIMSTTTGTEPSPVIDISYCPNGLYFIHISSEANETFLSERVIINK